VVRVGLPDQHRDRRGGLVAQAARYHDVLGLSRKIRYTVLALTLVLSALAGVAAFEWISPIGMAHRELLFGAGLGWTAVVGVFLFDLFVLRNGWCGHLCPLGAFYALLGATRPRYE